MRHYRLVFLIIILLTSGGCSTLLPNEPSSATATQTYNQSKDTGLEVIVYNQGPTSLKMNIMVFKPTLSSVQVTFKNGTTLTKPVNNTFRNGVFLIRRDNIIDVSAPQRDMVLNETHKLQSRHVGRLRIREGGDVSILYEIKKTTNTSTEFIAAGFERCTEPHPDIKRIILRRNRTKTSATVQCNGPTKTASG